MSAYAYSFGIIKSLEAQLLSQIDIERLVEAPNVEASFKVFNDTDYADNLADLDVNNFRQVLLSDLQQLHDLYSQIIDDKNLLALLFSNYDFHNIKLAFKAKKAQNKDLSIYLMPLGYFDEQKIWQVIIDDFNVDFPEIFRKIIDNLKQKIDSKTSPQIIDRLVDQEMFTYWLALVKKIKNQFVKDFIKLKIDLLNFKIFVRLQINNIDKEQWSEEFIEGGNLSYSMLVSAAEKDLVEFLKKMEFELNIDLSDYWRDKSLGQIEKAIAEKELEYLANAKYFNYGPEVAIAYYYAKLNALQNARLIMTAKLNDIAVKDIKQLVRKLW